MENHLNWVPDPMSPPTRCPDDLASPSPSENTPPQDASRKLPRKLRPRRRKERQPGSSGIGSQTANRNSAFQGTGSATRPRSTANENSAFPGAGSATRPRSTANDNSPLAGNRTRINRSVRSTPVEHPLTFLRPQHSQSPRFSANENAGRRFDPDHLKSGGI